MAIQQVFKRVEKKYLVDTEQYDELMAVLALHMNTDEYGLHTICNVYYDNVNHDLIRVSIDKPVYKEKFRVRSYGIPSSEDTIFLEIKKKAGGVVYKRRIPFKLREATEILKKINESDKMSGIIVGIDSNNSVYPVFDEISNRQIRHEIEYIIKHYNL
ncbi:MAG: VTC domain-containing protein, partial [Lachnospiraceae bacterium]|nr:VTC domain-containing protein [Lachnospiraceae bacterium]